MPNQISQVHVNIKGNRNNTVNLETIIQWPENTSISDCQICVIVTHPHPKLGGNTFNNVTDAISHTLAQGYALKTSKNDFYNTSPIMDNINKEEYKLYNDLSLSDDNTYISRVCGKLTTIQYTSPNVCTISFNSRGVLGSTGITTWTGIDEIQDLYGICSYALSKESNIKAKYYFLIGYSFGGAILGSALKPIQTLLGNKLYGTIMVSYPCGFMCKFLLGIHFDPLRQTLLDDKTREDGSKKSPSTSSSSSSASSGASSSSSSTEASSSSPVITTKTDQDDNDEEYDIMKLTTSPLYFISGEDDELTNVPSFKGLFWSLHTKNKYYNIDTNRGHYWENKEIELVSLIDKYISCRLGYITVPSSSSSSPDDETTTKTTSTTTNIAQRRNNTTLTSSPSHNSTLKPNNATIQLDQSIYTVFPSLISTIFRQSNIWDCNIWVMYVILFIVLFYPVIMC